MNTTAIRLGTVAISDEAYFHEIVDKMVATRERVKPLLRELGFRFGDSKSNFIFVTHESISAEELFQMLREKNIFVRYFRKPKRIDNYLRISIGTDEQMDTLLQVLREYIVK